MQFTPYSYTYQTPTSKNQEFTVADFYRYGVVLRADDHGDAAGSATPLTGPDLSADGIIAFGPTAVVALPSVVGAPDEDWFTFDVAAGEVVSLSVTSSPHNRSPDVTL